jgi:hypothetical protein
MEHVMIDIETLGTGRDAVILSMAAVKFDKKEVYEEAGLYLKLNWQDQLNNGGTVTENTIRFWFDMVYKDNNMYNTLNKNSIISPNRAIMALSTWFQENITDKNACCVWANGPSFDLSLIGDLYRRFGETSLPWPFWTERCVRTAKMMNGVDTIKRPKESTPHHAFEDAVYQAKIVRKFLISCGAKNNSEDAQTPQQDLDLLL